MLQSYEILRLRPQHRKLLGVGREIQSHRRSPAQLLSLESIRALSDGPLPRIIRGFPSAAIGEGFTPGLRPEAPPWPGSSHSFRASLRKHSIFLSVS